MGQFGQHTRSRQLRRTGIDLIVGFLVVNFGRMLISVAARNDWLAGEHRGIAFTLLTLGVVVFYGFSFRRVGDLLIWRAYLASVVLLTISRFIDLGLPATQTAFAVRSTLDSIVMFLLLCQFARLHTLAGLAEQKREERLLKKLADATSHRFGRDFLSGLAAAVVKILKFQMVFISEAMDQDLSEQQVISIATAPECELPPGFEVGTSVICDEISLQRVFPDRAVSVVALHDRNETVIGHICLIQTLPSPSRPISSASLGVFASRASAELQRRAADRKNAALETKMLQVQKLESIGLLAGGIAHDFNNFWCAIRNNVSLARKSVPDDADATRYLDRIDSTVEKGTGMCRRLLAYAGQGVRQNVAVDVNQLINETVEIVRSARPECSDLKLQLSDADPQVLGDEAQLSQVVLNVLTNAVDAVADNEGQIVVRSDVRSGTLSSESMALEPNVDYAFMEVQDEGAGIEPDVISRIFDPFFSTKGEQGRGLGLAAVAGIVRGHQGDLVVESKMGEGTKFTVAIPVNGGQPEPEQTSAGLEGTVEPTAGACILVVDDDDMVRQSIILLLEVSGYQVVAADGGEAAIEKFQASDNVIDAMLLDQNMPGMTGTETCRRLRELGAVCPAIFISGYIDATQQEELEGLVVVRKPYTQEQLLSAIEEQLARVSAE